MKEWIASSATADGARDALSVEILSRRQLKFFIGWRLKSISAASRYKINAIFFIKYQLSQMELSRKLQFRSCLAHALYAEVNAQCDKPVKVVGRASIVGGIVNLWLKLHYFDLLCICYTTFRQWRRMICHRKSATKCYRFACTL